jgi:hypothetical protein
MRRTGVGDAAGERLLDFGDLVGDAVGERLFFRDIGSDFGERLLDFGERLLDFGDLVGDFGGRLVKKIGLRGSDPVDRFVADLGERPIDDDGERNLFERDVSMHK